MKNKNCLCIYESPKPPYDDAKPVLNIVQLSNRFLQLSRDP